MVQRTDTTNERLACVLEGIDELMEWAKTDAEHATENEAYGTADDDRRRLSNLIEARRLLQDCKR